MSTSSAYLHTMSSKQKCSLSACSNATYNHLRSHTHDVFITFAATETILYEQETPVSTLEKVIHRKYVT